METQFLVTDPEWQGSAQVDGFRVHRLELREPHALLRYLNGVGVAGAPVLLNYVGYGYARRGAPVWLLKSLKTWRRSSSANCLVVYFHELFATGAPWTSSFWLSPLQRWICRELALLASALFTNRAASALWLDAKLRHRTSVTQVFPVFSNFGNPSTVPLLSARAPQLMVYGGIARNPSDKEMAAVALRRKLAQLGLQRIVTFGPVNVDATDLGVPVINRGIVPPEQVAPLMLASRAGYLDYPPAFAGKSSVLASFCANGLAPLLLRGKNASVDGLVEGHNYLAVATDVNSDDTRLQATADAAREWYAGHSLPVVARSIMRSLRSPQTLRA